MVAAPQSLLAHFLPEWLAQQGWQERVQPYLRATGWVASDYFQALARAECDLAICYWPVGRCDLDIDTSSSTYRVIGQERLIPVTGLTSDGSPCTQLPGTRQQPVMIHSAKFGSIERFIGVLVEHYAGQFPVWLAPVQVLGVPVAEDFQPYLEDVLAQMRAQGIRTEIDASDDRFPKKIRNASKCMMRSARCNVRR